MILDGAILTFCVRNFYCCSNFFASRGRAFDVKAEIASSLRELANFCDIVLLLHFGGVRTSSVLFDPPKIDHMGSDKLWFLDFLGNGALS